MSRRSGRGAGQSRRLRAAPTAAERALGGGRSGSTTRPPGTAASALRGGGVDAYFGVRREHMRYLTGFTSARARRRSRATRAVPRRRRRRRDPGRLALHDPGTPEAPRLGSSRPTTTCRPLARADVVGRGAARRGRGRVRLHRRWDRLAAAAPDVELVPVEAGSKPTGRSRSRPRSSASRPPARSPTGRSPRCCPRSGPVAPRPTSRSGSSG
jgi:hypothetical protein